MKVALIILLFLVTHLAGISHTFSEKIEPLEVEIALPIGEDNVRATWPRLSEEQDRPSECSSFPRKCEKSRLMAYETVVESDEAHYNGEKITLTGHVSVANAMGKVVADLAILKKDEQHLTKIDFPWIELHHRVQLNLSKGGILTCETLFLDYTTLSALIEGGPQVAYHDTLGEVYADRARIDYQEKNGSLEATQVTLYDNVRLVNKGSDEKPASQYALADIVYYFPPEQRMILETVHNRVLFFDQLRGVQLSASHVQAQRDPETQKESIQGKGDVRFVFGPEELDKIKNRFQ